MSAGDVDLNLLRVLDALLEHGSVAGAAEQLHLSAPAVSRSLARLRRALDDPLLVRSGRGLVPTPRAQAISADVQQALLAATSVLTPQASAFDPSQLQRRFVITADDAMLASFGVTLVHSVAEAAPGVGLDFLPDTNETELLRSGTIDLDLGAFHESHSEIKSETLGTVTFVAVVREGHPLASKTLTVRRYVDAHHIAVSSKGKYRGPMDDALAELGFQRDRITLVPSFMSAAYMVAGSDAIALLPDATVRELQTHLPIVAMALPVETPVVAVAQSWHIRYDMDPAHRWLRSIVRDRARSRLDSGLNS